LRRRLRLLAVEDPSLDPVAAPTSSARPVELVRAIPMGATRRAARVALLDGNARVLLLQHAGSEGRPFWATPGGGVEPGETFEHAALRECREDLGLDMDPEQLRPGWTGTARFDLAGEPVGQEERFYVLHVDALELGSACSETHRQEGILQSRWWTISELAATRECVFPRTSRPV
jgi:ADP-ribose pyrophosphatase YjhB (NUDIX family)